MKVCDHCQGEGRIEKVFFLSESYELRAELCHDCLRALVTQLLPVFHLREHHEITSIRVAHA
jgi:hypothetical protein